MPLEVWWELEDLWTRLNQLRRLHLVEPDALLFPSWRDWQEEQELRAALLDLKRYRWSNGLAGLGGSFVRTLDCTGDDLFCQLTPTAVVRGWPDGPSLVHLRLALMARWARPVPPGVRA